MQPARGTQGHRFHHASAGAMASLMLAEAGAEVVKIERPPSGDGMRGLRAKAWRGEPLFRTLESRQDVCSSRSKGSRGGEPSEPAAATRLTYSSSNSGPASCLGLGSVTDTVRKLNPKIVYCSITGYGQEGPKASRAGHDLNYVAESGLLSLVADSDGAPQLPPTLIADIGGGAYPAVINILLGLL